MIQNPNIVACGGQVECFFEHNDGKIQIHQTSKLPNLTADLYL